MKICLLSRDFLPNVGGISAHVYELGKGLVKEGNEVHLLTYKNTISDKKHENIEGIKIYKIYMPNIRMVGRFLYAFFELISLLSLIKKENIDIIHSHTIIPDDFVSLFLYNRCKIITEHSSRFLLHVENNIRINFYKILLNHSDHITGPSKQLINAFIKIGINKNKLSFISNGVDIQKFNPLINGNDIKKLYKITSKEKIILCPTRLTPVKGTKYLIFAISKVIKHNKNIKTLIVGDGSELYKLKNLANKLNINEYIIFTKNVPNTKMPKYYAISDIVVLPSLKEATSIAGLEAMASGKVLIGSNIGGIPYIIEDNITGILVPPKNPEKIADAILDLLNNKQKRHNMGIKARKRVENKFSWDIIIKKFIYVYNKAYLKKYTSKK